MCGQGVKLDGFIGALNVTINHISETGLSVVIFEILGGACDRVNLCFCQDYAGIDPPRQTLEPLAEDSQDASIGPSVTEASQCLVFPATGASSPACVIHLTLFGAGGQL